MSDSVANLHLRACLDTRTDISHVAALDFGTWLHVHAQDTYLVGIVFRTRIDELYLVAFSERAIYNLVITYHAFVAVEY